MKNELDYTIRMLQNGYPIYVWQYRDLRLSNHTDYQPSDGPGFGTFNGKEIQVISQAPDLVGKTHTEQLNETIRFFSPPRAEEKVLARPKRIRKPLEK